MNQHEELIAGTAKAHELALKELTPETITALENQLQRLLVLV